MADIFVESAVLRDDMIKIRGEEIPVIRGMVRQSDLNFYPENPRLYSLLMRESGSPSQQEIFSQLEKMDHVQKLVKSIALNGGLIEPIIVRDGDAVVLEGNSRLAAYRSLYKEDPFEWAEIDCKVLPADVSESSVFSLLGEFHIVGKKDWAPFEQAGYLYRRQKKHDLSLDELEKEVGLSKIEIGHLIRVYEYMIDVHESDLSKWSYYDAFLRSRKLKSAVEKHAGLEGKIVRMIKNDEFARAMDLRDKMPVVTNSGSKLVKKLIEGNISFEDAVERAVSMGGRSNAIRTLKKFREWISDVDIGDEIKALDTEAKSDCKYELNRIRRRSKALMDSYLK